MTVSLRANHLKGERVRDEEAPLNNPQPSVIRSHRRSRATLFSFVLEDAAPPTPRAWSILDRVAHRQRYAVTAVKSC